MIKLKTLLEVQLIKEALPLSIAREYVSIQRNPKITTQMNSIMDFLKNQPGAIISKNNYRIAIPFEVKANKMLTYDSDNFIKFVDIINAIRYRVNEISPNQFPDIADDKIVFGKFIDQYNRELKPSKYITQLVSLFYKYEPVNTITDDPYDRSTWNIIHQDVLELRKQYDTITDITERIKKLTTDLVNLYDSIVEVQEFRSNKPNSYYIIFSTHAYDIAGMSTGRGWGSCMNLYDGGSKQFVHQDIKEGTIIAYLITSQDLNIQNPISRILIKPYINIKDKNDVVYDPDPEYGTAPTKFYKTVYKLIDAAQPGKQGNFELVDSLYCDNALTDRDSVITKGKSKGKPLNKDNNENIY